MGWRGLATCRKELQEIGQFLSCMAWSPGWQAPSVQLGLLQLRWWLSLFHPPISKNRSGKRCGRSYALSAITNLIRFFSSLPSLHAAGVSSRSHCIPQAWLHVWAEEEVVGKSQCRWEARNTLVYGRSPYVSVEVRWSWGYHAMRTVMVILPSPDHDLLAVCFPLQ